MANNVYRQKGIDLKRLDLINFQGKSSDIRKLVLEFSIFEDIFSNSVKAEFVIEDTVGLIERFPIVGDEFIAVRFATPTFSEEVDMKFRVYRVSDRKQVKERSHRYTIHCVSPHLQASLQQIVEKSFKGQKVSDIVQTVHSEYFDAVGVTKSIEIEPTAGTTSIIAPRINPYEFLNLLASEAQSEKYPDSGMYLFFEDHEKFNFVTVNKLLDEPSKYDYYYADPSTGKNSKEVKDDQIIFEIDYKNFIDTLNNSTSGLYDNAVVAVDPITRRYRYYTFNYEEDFNKLTNLGTGKLIAREGGLKAATGASHTKLLITNVSLDDQDYSSDPAFEGALTESDPFNYHSRRRHLFLAAGTAQVASLKQMTTNIAIPGDSRRKAGDIVRLFVPEQSGEQQHQQKYNAFYGPDPKFIVTAVTHRYKANTNEYWTLMQCAKNAFGKQPTAE